MEPAASLAVLGAWEGSTGGPRGDTELGAMSPGLCSDRQDPAAAEPALSSCSRAEQPSPEGLWLGQDHPAGLKTHQGQSLILPGMCQGGCDIPATSTLPSTSQELLWVHPVPPSTNPCCSKSLVQPGFGHFQG